jgi:hypothetical protein
MNTEQISSDINTTPTNAPVTQTPVEEAVGTPNIAPPTETSQEVDSARAIANDPEQLMKMFLDMEQQNQAMKEQLSSAESKHIALKKQWDEKAKNEELQTKSKAEALSQALIESWQATLPPGEMTDENKEAIFAMAQNFPKESVKMFEIAHKASMKHKERALELQQSHASSKKRLLEQQVVEVITKKRRSMPAPQQFTHAASTKQIQYAPVHNPYTISKKVMDEANKTFGESNKQLFSALKGLSGGNARSVMDNIANYRNTKL